MKNLGKYIVADPKICHGQPTFKGTRILVKAILEQLEDGFSWDEIIYEWDDKINKDAIREAIHLAALCLENHQYEPAS